MDNTAKHSPRITAEEYYRRTAENSERTELRGGEIVSLASPSLAHQQISGEFYRAVSTFIRSQCGKCKPFQAVDVQLSDDTIVVPDFLTICDPSKCSEKRISGAPDWIVEIVSSNRKDDMIVKLGLYQQSGVREYWIVDPQNRRTLVYFFEENNFPSIYTFDAPIPVGIYNGALTICIDDFYWQ